MENRIWNSDAQEIDRLNREADHWMNQCLEKCAKNDELSKEVERHRENFKKANYARNDAQVEVIKKDFEIEALKSQLEEAKGLLNEARTNTKRRPLIAAINSFLSDNK